MEGRKLVRSFAYAMAGIGYAFSTQRNMKIHGLAAVLVVIAGFIAGISRVEWGILSITIFMVLTAETINTAVEKTVDMITTDHQPLAGVAKNLAAGAVLLTAINALVIAFLIFGPYLAKL